MPSTTDDTKDDFFEAIKAAAVPGAVSPTARKSGRSRRWTGLGLRAAHPAPSWRGRRGTATSLPSSPPPATRRRGPAPAQASPPHRPPACGAPLRHAKASLSIPQESSKSLDTTQRPVYAVPGQQLVEGSARDDALSRRGDGYNQGRTRRPGSRHRAPLEITDGRGAHAVLAGHYGGAPGRGIRGIAGLWPFPPAPPPVRGLDGTPARGRRSTFPRKPSRPLRRGRPCKNRCNPAPRRVEPREVHAQDGGGRTTSECSSPHRCHACHWRASLVGDTGSPAVLTTGATA